MKCWMDKMRTIARDGRCVQLENTITWNGKNIIELTVNGQYIDSAEVTDGVATENELLCA